MAAAGKLCAAMLVRIGEKTASQPLACFETEEIVSAWPE